MHRSFLSVAILLIAIGYASADTPTTQPTTQPLDYKTPMSFITGYDGLAGEDPPAYLQMYYLDDADDTQRLAHVQAKFDAQAGMLQKMVQDRWGNDAVDQTLHALGLKSLRDIQSATIKQSGHHASVIFADGTPGPELVKTAAGWRLDLPALCKSLGMPVDDYLRQIRQLSKILPDLADAIADGKLKEPSDVVHDIAKKINASANQ